MHKCRSGKESDSEAEDLEHAEKLRHVKAVLEEVLVTENVLRDHCPSSPDGSIDCLGKCHRILSALSSDQYFGL